MVNVLQRVRLLSNEEPKFIKEKILCTWKWFSPYSAFDTFKWSSMNLYPPIST